MNQIFSYHGISGQAIALFFRLAKKCFYPLSIPFLKSGIKSQFKNTTLVLYLFTIVTFGCTLKEDKSQYEILLEYEGKYEYIGNSTLTLVASEIDTILYAVIDKAKYPLHYVSKDTFTNVQNIPITFQRNENGKIKSYTTEGEAFFYLSSDFEKNEVFPRKQLFHNPEGYSYKIPEKTNDGLDVGNLKVAFKNPQPILDMVRETIRNTYPDVHSILIYKDEKLVLEEYFYGFDKDVPHQLRSATKPFIGALVGITIEKEMIGSQHDLLLPYFDNQYASIANLDQRKKKITIEDFLTYRHGMDCENNIQTVREMKLK